MANPTGQTPLNLTFPRSQFLQGGPSADAEPATLLVFDDKNNLLYQFDNMLVYQLSTADAEHTAFVQSSNATVKLYSFDRALAMLSVQLIVVDATAKDGDTDPDRFTQQAYQEFLWLYENELKISQGIRKRRNIAIEIRGFKHYGYFISETDGWASEGEWMVAATFEFIVLRSERMALPSGGNIDAGASSVISSRNQLSTQESFLGPERTPRSVDLPSAFTRGAL